MNKKKLSSNVFVLGIVSLFNDFSSEMVYPIIPLFLAGLGAPVSIIGMIEAIAELTTNFFKLFFGVLSDRLGKRKVFVTGGYFFTAFAKTIIGLAFHWPLVLIGRIVDRIGKGMRTAPRDALITESSFRETYGISFGLHRALDTVGAIVGPLASVGFLALFGGTIRPIFFIASLFGFISVVLVVWFVRTPAMITSKRQSFSFSEPLTKSFIHFLLASSLFALGNSSNVFLILKAKALGMSTIAVTLMYAAYNLAYAGGSFFAGMASDKIGPRKVLMGGFFLFAVIYFFLGLCTSHLWMWLLFMGYGIYMALTDGISSAYISLLVEQRKLASTFGLYQAVTGVCTFFATLAAGFLWTHIGMNAPFFVGAFFALIAVIVFTFVSNNKK